MGVVGIVLLIVCNNLASLLLARSSARQKEMGIRVSLGAGRVRLVRQLLTESLLIGLVGGGAGLFLAVITSNKVLVSTGAPVTVQLDGRVLLFTLVLSMLAVLAFGLAPALQVSRTNPVATLRAALGTTDKSTHRLRKLLIFGQITLSLILLICGGLFLKSIRNVGNVDAGFDARQGLVVPLDLGLQNYSEEKGREFYRQLLERVRAQPLVQSESLTEYVPLDASTFGQAVVTLDGQTTRPEEMDAFRAGIDTVSPDYFRTMGIPILRGRAIEAEDSETSPKVVVVNESMARRFWPNAEAVGQRISLSGARGPLYEVVGVVKDGAYRILGEKPQPYLYRALAQNYVPNMTLVVRTANDPASALAGVRAEIERLDSNLPLTRIKSIAELVSQSLLPARVAALMLGVFGLLALILAAAGIYGATACSVSERTYEIGIRMALGAKRRDILKLIGREGLTTVVAGIGLGLVLGFSVSQVIRSFIFGILSGDVVTFVIIPLILVGVTLLACYVPARRAMRIGPIIALKSE
jgi:predicted permease